MEKFKTCDKFCHRSLVDQVGSGGGKDMCGDVGNVTQGHVEKPEGKSDIEQKVFPVRCVGFAAEREYVGIGVGDGDKNACQREHFKSALYISGLIVADLGKDEFLGGLHSRAAECVTKQGGVYAFAVFWEIVFVAGEDVVLHFLAQEIVVGGDPFSNTLGHTANKHVGAQQTDQLVVQGKGKRGRTGGLVSGFHQQILSVGNEKLIEGHRVHEHGVDSAYSEGGERLKGKLQKRACRNDMQGRHVFFEKTKGHDGFGAFLYLVNKEEGLAWFDSATAQCGNLGNDAGYIEVGKKSRLVLRFSFQVDFNVAGKLSAELSDGSGFPDLSCSPKEYGLAGVA